MNIFVAKLSSSTTNEDLQDLFSGYGQVSSAKVVFDRETGNSKRFGFVEMPSDEEGDNAIQALDGADFQGSKIVVKVARPREDNRSSGGFRRERRY